MTGASFALAGTVVSANEIAMVAIEASKRGDFINIEPTCTPSQNQSPDKV